MWKDGSKMFDEIKRYADFIHWLEEKHPEIIKEYENTIKNL
jgi:hypothetical protein